MSEDSDDLTAIEVIDGFLSKLRGEYRSNTIADLLIDSNDFFIELSDDEKVTVLNYLMGLVVDRQRYSSSDIE